MEMMILSLGSVLAANPKQKGISTLLLSIFVFIANHRHRNIQHIYRACFPHNVQPY